MWNFQHVNALAQRCGIFNTALPGPKLWVSVTRHQLQFSVMFWRHSMRRRIASKAALPALLAAAALVAGAAACSAPGDPATPGGVSTAGTQAGTKAPLVIGISLSLTGDF